MHLSETAAESGRGLWLVQTPARRWYVATTDVGKAVVAVLPRGKTAVRPGQSSRPADAIAVAPATFDTVDKWAAGISDDLALGILCGAPAMGVPVAVLPYLNSAQAAHPAYRRSPDLLREMGVLIGSYEPHRPKAGGGADRYRWEEVPELLAPRLSART
ncbi:flavoprotein [Streptomyces sp. BSE7-9]|uniref:flavoprotein n=1 Tax=Streptomyces sp. BSE7-9 TaxID=2759948 RepID=UPI0018EE789D|nr:hypothetical protein [Streptomyces sp. BSE7-9]